MAKVEIDDSSFKQGVKKLAELTEKASKMAIGEIGLEILRLSINGPPPQVPHNKGILQNSADIEESYFDNSLLVGFNTQYAARLHENPQYHFQKGRKGKYLEDPIKNNLSLFRKIYGNIVAKVITK